VSFIHCDGVGERQSIVHSIWLCRILFWGQGSSSALQEKSKDNVSYGDLQSITSSSLAPSRTLSHRQTHTHTGSRSIWRRFMSAVIAMTRLRESNWERTIHEIY